jgi:hypothetical protein
VEEKTKAWNRPIVAGHAAFHTSAVHVLGREKPASS